MATSFNEDNLIEEDIRLFVDSVWECVSAKITSNWLDRLEVPIAANVSLLKLTRVVAWATHAYDGAVQADMPLEKHTPDEEPMPVSIDPWARGTGMLDLADNYDIYLFLLIYRLFFQLLQESLLKGLTRVLLISK